MKIINSHYIPLPEPRWLIADPKGSIYEQLGTLTIVEDSSKEKGKSVITTHSHPVVAYADIDVVEDDGKNFKYMSTLTRANGKVLDDVLNDDCFRLCPSGCRNLTYIIFNMLVLRYETGPHYEDFFLDDFIEDLRSAHVKLIFPDKELQEVSLTTFETGDEGNKSSVIMSDPSQIFFISPFWATADKKGVHIEWEEIFMEYVNQARSYLQINPKYRFHFKSSLDLLAPLVEKLNNELNDYLERKEE